MGKVCLKPEHTDQFNCENEKKKEKRKMESKSFDKLMIEIIGLWIEIQVAIANQ